MPFRSKWTVEIATCSFPTWIFGSPDAALPDDSALFIDSNHPETHFLSLHGYRQWSQRLATGIRAAGLKVRLQTKT
jgi:4-coumarate--CoA ligase